MLFAVFSVTAVRKTKKAVIFFRIRKTPHLYRVLYHANQIIA